jgi:RNA polymerase sigma-70 factor, ECF subfamily
MADPERSDRADIDRLRGAAGDARALADQFARYRSRLKRMVKLRMDPRVQGRVDPSDVVQEAYIEADRQLTDYLADPQLPVFLWLRLVTGQQLVVAHRRHLGVQSRDAGREVSIYRGPVPEASSAALAAQLLGRLTTPSQAAARAELKLRVQETLNGLDPVDREVLALRHFEQLGNAEVATVLGVSPTAACNRYVRALERLRAALGGFPGEV